MQPLTLFKAATPLLEKIYRLPFNVHLAEGSLARQSFKSYVEQDLLYLATYIKLVTKTAEHFKKEADSAQNSKYARYSETLFEFNKETIVYEEELRQKFLSNRAFTIIQPAPPKKTRILDAQTQEILAIANAVEKPFGLAKTMVLITACPWVYLQIGKHLEREPIQPIAHVQAYKDWILAYKPNSPFEDSVDKLKRILADVLTPISEESNEGKEILDLFLKAVQFEHDFFSAADLGLSSKLAAEDSTAERFDHCCVMS